MRPSFEDAAVAARLARFLRFDPLDDAGIRTRVRRLGGRFAVWVERARMWAPGEVPSAELRALSDVYLPFEEIHAFFRRLHELTLLPPHPAWMPPLPAAWVDFPRFAREVFAAANPASLASRLLDDGTFRARFLFFLHLPDSFGASFGRYPLQLQSIAPRLRGRADTPIRCLDTACGTGEGTWDLAATLLACGFDPSRFSVRGETPDPFEVFAAAHGYFPHSAERQAAYRAQAAPLLRQSRDAVTFARGDVCAPPDGETYDLVLCNGLLGGPLLHEPAVLAAAVSRLVSRVAPGGILLAADRFHEGWKMRSPVENMFAGNGLSLIEVGEGVAGMRPALGREGGV